MIESMLTTYDNPYDPFTDYDNWYAYDSRLNYYTPALLARVVVYSSEMSEVDQSLAIERAIDEIVYENVSGMHKKVSRDSKTTPIKSGDVLEN